MSGLKLFEQACLAPDPTQNRVFTAGTIRAFDGQLSVDSVTSYDTEWPAVNWFNYDGKDSKWRTFLPKYCFPFPAETNLSSGGGNITVIQLGDKESIMASFGAGYSGNPHYSVTFEHRLVSPKLVALNGLYATTGLFSVYTNTTGTNQWVGIRMDLKNSTGYRSR